VVTTADEAQQSVAQQVTEGYDAIKVYTRLNREAYDAIIAEAAVHSIPVVGHPPDAVGLEHCIGSGQHTNEHLLGYDIDSSDGSLEALTAEIGMVNCPTLVVWDKYAKVDELQQQGVDELCYVHPLLVDRWMSATPYEPHPIAALQAKLHELDELSAPLIAGTDASNPFVIAGLSLHEELELWVGAGLSPYRALRGATYDAASHRGALDRLGTIEPDKEADLLLLDANPLEDIANTRAIAGVMVKGVWYPRAALDELLDGIVAYYTDHYGADYCD